MKNRTHWLETADYVTSAPRPEPSLPDPSRREGRGRNRILGEDQHGDLYVPSKTRAEWWDRRFNPWNPMHWPYYLRSRITNHVAFLEVER